jgi:thioredoxin reductase
VYECAIIGGGIAGLQAAIQLGRYRHSVVVVDAGDGRSTLCRGYHNLLGWPDGVSGETLRRAGRLQAGRYGVTFIDGVATAVRREPAAGAAAGNGRAAGPEAAGGPGGGSREDGLFVVTLADGAEVRALRLLIATGVKDRIPDWPELRPCLGVSVFICPDCDGWETTGRRTIVLGAGDAGANLAMELTPWTRDIVYVNHERTPLDPAVAVMLREAGIPMIEAPVERLLADDGHLRGVRLADGAELEAERAFLGFGGNEVRSSLAAMLGARLSSSRHIEVDPRTKLTSVPHVWAAGDVTVHSEQTAIAMGDGLQAAIWMHKSLTLREPLPPAAKG